MQSQPTCAWHTKRVTNLANVDVRAFRVDLGVVQVEDGCVEAKVLRDDVASVVCLDDIGLLAILALSAEAEGLTRLEV